MVSYLITVSNEIEEFKKLYSLLNRYKHYEDDIIILIDDSKTSNEIIEYLDSKNQIYHLHSLNNDFSTHKNYLKSLSTQQYLFFLDADELPDIYLIKNLHEIITHYLKDTNILWIPRINIVKNITSDYIKEMNWQITSFQDLTNIQHIDKLDYSIELLKEYNLIKSINENYITYNLLIINYPDLQSRICRNLDYINYSGKVHERLIDSSKSYNYLNALPNDLKYTIFHNKTFTKQKQQNDYYKTITIKRFN